MVCSIRLTQGKFALVDDEDYDWLNQWRWYYSQGYAHKVKNKNTKQISMHRFIVNPPKGMEVDHIDGDGLNNQRSNLRVCTKQQNKYNVNSPKSNTSGYKGVSWRKDIHKWQAHIRINGIKIYLGYFDDIKDAARAYNTAAKTFHGIFARLNIVEDKNDATNDN